MTLLQNAPIGWRAFRQFRQRPVPLFVRRHGNRKHGRYSKQGISDMRMVRLCIRMLRAGLGHVLVPGRSRAIPPGWDAYYASRSHRTGTASRASVALRATGPDARQGARDECNHFKQMGSERPG